MAPETSPNEFGDRGKLIGDDWTKDFAFCAEYHTYHTFGFGYIRVETVNNGGSFAVKVAIDYGVFYTMGWGKFWRHDSKSNADDSNRLVWLKSLLFE
jgi:hypothetical protein